MTRVFLLMMTWIMTSNTALPQETRAAQTVSAEEEFKAIRAEWDAAINVASEAMKKAQTREEKQALYSRFMPNPITNARRVLAVAEKAPKDATTRDALLWILQGTQGSPDGFGAWGIEVGSTVDMLIAHYSGDLKVARMALILENSLSPQRDRLVKALYERAEDPAARGTAILAMGQNLLQKASAAEGLKSRKARIPFWTEEYERQIRNGDPNSLRAEGELLLKQVIEKYPDFPYVRAGRRASRDLAQKLTLGQAAEARLDELHNLAVGKPAPEIVGKTLDGNPMKLSDYRGKIVVLVFWFSTCGPCMVEVPYERQLVERQKGKPFALLGVDSEENKEAAREVVRREGMTWPSWYDGDPTNGPIVALYHIQGYPRSFVIDSKGIIRYKNLKREKLDESVDILMKELEQSGKASPKEALDPSSTPSSKTG